MAKRKTDNTMAKRKTDNTMAKRKRTNNDLQKIHIKLKIEKTCQFQTQKYKLPIESRAESGGIKLPISS